MKTKLTEEQLQLLREIVSTRCPALINRITAETAGFNQQERTLVLDAVRNEFAASGVGPDSEPTKRGLKIEELQDIINRPNLRKL